MRLLPSGELDTSFGSGSGFVTVRHDDVFGSEAWDVTQLADGRMAVAGRAYWAVSPTSWGDIAVAVLNPDGSRDTGFGAVMGLPTSTPGAPLDPGRKTVSHRSMATAIHPTRG